VTSVKWSVCVDLALIRQTTYATLNVKQALKESTTTVGASVRKDLRAMVLTVRNRTLLAEAGAHKKCAKIAKSLDFFGTLNALRATTARDVAFARKTAPLEWEM